MANKKDIQSAIRELSASHGGSLVKEIKKAKMKPEPIVFISLGGLGGKTLQALKNVIKNEYEDTHTVAFLAVDTATTDLNDYKDLELDEKFEIYDPTCVTLPSQPPAEARRWLNPKLPKTNLKNTGAEGTRQIARLMLCGTNKYSALQARISAIIDRVRRDNTNPIQINLIAGISGGTGSGTIIDVAYMIHNLMHEKNIPTYELKGFLFLPDAQKHIPEIQNTPATWASLQRNGYAALKEIDYFMTNGSDGADKPLYELETLGVRITSSKKIFEPGNCILVSSVTPNSAVTDIGEIIERFANFIAYIFTDNSAVTVSAEARANVNVTESQDILSTMCNLGRATMPNWKMLNIATDQAESDNPNWAGYHYSAIGYCSLYVPRDEIFAYCANLVFEKIYDEWFKLDILNQEKIDDALKAKGLDSVTAIHKFVKKITGDTLRYRTRVRPEDPEYPVITKILGIGKTKNTDATKSKADDLAAKVKNSLRTPATKQLVVKAIVNSILQIVKANFDAYGPFFATAMLSGLDSNKIEGRIHGFLDRLGAIKSEISQKVRELKDRALAAKVVMEESEKLRLSDLTPTPEETEEFVSACEQYTQAAIDVIIMNELDGILTDVYNELVNVNNDTYEIYSMTIEVLADMLHEDSVFAADSTRQVNGKGEKFHIDAVGFKQSKAMRERFLQLFSDVIDDNHASLLADEFKSNMFGPNTKQIWIQASQNRSQFAQNLRDIFKRFFDQYVNDTLEKFLVIASNPNEPNLTPQRLTEIWVANEQNNPEDFLLRNRLIQATAQQILHELDGNGSVMMRSVVNQAHIEKFPRLDMVCLISSTPHINQAIRALNPNLSYTECDKDFRSTITMFKMRCGLPAATISGMKDYAEVYYNAERTLPTRVGRHMNESEDKGWDYYLPELYGLDADEFYTSHGYASDLDMAVEDPEDFRDLAIMKRIRQCVKTGIEQGWIIPESKSNPDHYNLCRVSKVYDDYKTFREKLDEKLSDGSFASIWDIAREKNSGIVVDTVPLAPIDSSDSNLDILQLPENDYSFSDLHRVIRKDMNLMQTLFSTYDRCQEDDSIIGVFKQVKREVEARQAQDKRINTLRQDISQFTKMFCFDLIQYDAENNIWMYRCKPEAEFTPLLPLYNGLSLTEKKIALYYFAFVEGYLKNETRIDPYIDTYKNPKTPREVLDKVLEITTSDELTDPMIEKRLEDLEEMRRSSVYKDFYGYPYEINDKDSTYKNLEIFYRYFLQYLKDWL